MKKDYMDDSNMKYWEVEFECDDSWSVSGLYPFYFKQKDSPTEEQLKEYLNMHGIKKIVGIYDVTDCVSELDINWRE